jgi:hypothetical protein
MMEGSSSPAALKRIAMQDWHYTHDFAASTACRAPALRLEPSEIASTDQTAVMTTSVIIVMIRD